MAPEPITRSLFGIVSGIIASFADHIYFPSGSKPACGMVRALAPVANITCLALYIFSPTRTSGASLAGCRDAKPFITVTLFFFIRCLMPAESWLAIFRDL